jgi:cobalt-zinc-cadmium efflux system membrane fusion protein
MRIATVLLLGLAVVTAFSSCRSRSAGEHGTEADQHRAAASAEGASGTPVLPFEGLRGIRWIAAPEPRAEGAWFPGEALGDESAQSVLSSPVSGRIVSAPTSPGRPVPRGTVLLEIESPEQAELLSRWLVAKAEVERAESTLAREERLASAGATSQREVDDARREVSIARAESESARLGLEARGLTDSDPSGRFSLRAPASGAVVRWDVRNGQGVEAGQALGGFQIASARLVRVDLSLPGPEWHLGDETEVRSSDGRHWKARVAGVPSVLSDDTRRLSFRLELVDGALPLPGQPVEVRVPFAVAVVLPQAALQQIEGVWGVFVQAGDRAAFHPVRRGVELGPNVVVDDGVGPGDVIAADGAYLLKSLWLKARSGGDEHED